MGSLFIFESKKIVANKFATKLYIATANKVFDNWDTEVTGSSEGISEPQLFAVE